MPPRPLNLDVGRFVNPAVGLGSFNLGDGLRSLAQQNMQRREMDNSMTRHSDNLGFQKKQHSENLNQRQSEERGQNTRYAITRGDQFDQRAYEAHSAKDAVTRKKLDEARSLAAKGKLEQVDSMIGSLAELGVNVNKSLDDKGNPIYRFEYNEQKPEQIGASFEDTLSLLNTGHDKNALNPQPETQPSSNPFTLESKSPVRVHPSTEEVYTPSDGSQPTTGLEQKPAEPALPEDPEFDPFSLDTGALRAQIGQRLNPVLEGIAGAFPGKYQGRINSILQGSKALGAPPEETLATIQKPLDTAARLMNAEEQGKNAAARVSITQSGAASSESRLRENEAWKRAAEKGKQVGLTDALDNMVEFDEVRDKINSGNPNAQADAIKQLIAMREGNRITDQDFKIGLSGLASNIEQLSFMAQKTYTSKLLPLQQERFNNFLDMLQEGNKRRVKEAQKKVLTLGRSFRYEPERYAAMNYLTGSIPEEMWDDELKNFDPLQDAGGFKPRSGQKPTTSKSISTSGQTTEEAASGVSKINDELDNILGQ